MQINRRTRNPSEGFGFRYSVVAFATFCAKLRQGNMSFENSLSGTMKLAHVLFMDIVSYSKRPIDEQASVLHTLQELVRDSSQVAKARKVDHSAYLKAIAELQRSCVLIS